MSRAAPTVDLSQQLWFNKYDAAEYMRRLGFRDHTHYTITYAARKGYLHRGEPKGRALHWRKEWLDDWVASK
jgi:hypothetical protein